MGKKMHYSYSFLFLYRNIYAAIKDFYASKVAFIFTVLRWRNYTGEQV